jgi:hypothetical protein
MKLKLASLAAAGATIGFLTFGGISLAGAQDTPTSTTAPAATADPGDGHCHHDGQDPATAPAPADAGDTGTSSGTTPGT